ncbi:MAG: hypothetical protein ACI935_003812 [Moritella dasanensis]|jgi:hypothetical protein
MGSDKQIAANNDWHISLRFDVDVDVDVFKKGMAPISFVKYLQHICRIITFTVYPIKCPI